MKMKSTMQIKDGHFIKDGFRIQPQIGNREQIAVLQAKERELNLLEAKFNGDGVECEFQAKNIEYTAICTVACLCGETIIDRDYTRRANSIYELEEMYIDWKDERISCHRCNRSYRIQDGRAKLIKA